MKFEATASFLADYGSLKPREKELFRQVIRELNAAYDQHLAGKGRDRPKWPKKMRIKDVEGAPGVWEITWSFSGPDGRATFEYIDMEGELGIRWRRIGGHVIFKKP